MAQWREHLRGEQRQQSKESASKEPASDGYDLPCGMAYIRRWTLFKFVPFCPTFLIDAKPGQTDDGAAADDAEGAVVTVN